MNHLFSHILLILDSVHLQKRIACRLCVFEISTLIRLTDHIASTLESGDPGRAKLPQRAPCLPASHVLLVLYILDVQPY